ncbi:Glucanosyltransferase-domain-containing protein [Corynascus similis CBS 632.67]
MCRRVVLRLTLPPTSAKVIDAFAGYDNTLAFGIGQETINENATSTLVAPSLKAAARDLHAFSTARGYRSIPLAYSASDVPSIRLLTAQYLTCSSSSSSSSSNNSSSSDDTTKDPATIDLLGFIIFLTESCTPRVPPAHSRRLESGCHPVEQGEAAESQRNFSEVAAVLGLDLRDFVLGANVYEWTKHDETELGLVQDTSSSSEGEPLRPQFDVLSRVFGNVAEGEVTSAAEYTPASRNNGKTACQTRDQAKGLARGRGQAAAEHRRPGGWDRDGSGDGDGHWCKQKQ